MERFKNNMPLEMHKIAKKVRINNQGVLFLTNQDRILR